ncbi:Serine protease SplB precursor [Caulifigura coniformis]|uniref:Serine protease n=2 Tax=Caulifigura coniformis TaxID=2527983 RepID=A0A517SBG6_9PLAN|nr:Serine protease SplB precursor [Caulifigura coniformis]
MKEWYVRRSGGDAGPFTESRLRKLLSEGMIEPGTRVRRGGDGEWQAVASVISIGARKKKADDADEDDSSDADDVNRRRIVLAAAGCAISAIVVVGLLLMPGREDKPADEKNAPAVAQPATLKPLMPEVPSRRPTSAIASSSPKPAPVSEPLEPSRSAPAVRTDRETTKPAAMAAPLAQLVTRPPVAELPAQPAPAADDDKPKEIKDTDLTRMFERLNLELTPEGGQRFLADLRKKYALTDKQEARLAAEEPRWNERKEKGLVRLGNRWVKPDVQNAAADKAKRLVSQATPLLRIGGFKEAINFLQEASDADGNSIEADFKLGLLGSTEWALLDAVNAEKHFKEVLRRSPDNVPALNNLAVAELKQRKHSQAIKHLSLAAALAPRCQEVSQNLGRSLFLDGQNRINLNADDERACAVVYSTLIAEGKGKEADVSKGFLLMNILLPKSERENPGSDPDRGQDLILTGSGSGFAVAPNLVLTNRHVAEHDVLGTADEIRIAVSIKGQPVRRLKGMVVALSDEADLALVKFDALDARPLPLREAEGRLGEEVAIVGFPRPDALGDDLKFVRGSINSVRPDELLFDCIANQGNSGGPVLLAGGEVVSVYTFVKTVGDEVETKHGGGVPSTLARRFVQKHAPVLPAAADQAGRDWPTMIEDVRDAIFKIEVYHSAGSPALQAAFARVAASKKNARFLEDRTCVSCGGRSVLPCPGKCIKGGVQRTWTEQQPGVIFGRSVMVPKVMTRVDPCTACAGRGGVDCPLCIQGVDKALIFR